MTPPRRVVLVGFMGAGKTTVGRVLARQLGWPFVDLDVLVEARAGRSITRIFEESGEAAFRQEEKAAAEEATHREQVVIAAGGGAFAQADTREVLRRGALTVWLRCGVDTLLRRIPEDGRRPKARNRERIGPLLADREPAYRLADIVVDTDSCAPDEAARAIARALGDLSREGPAAE